MKKITVTVTMRPAYNKELADMSQRHGLTKGSMIEKLMDLSDKGVVLTGLPKTGEE